MTTGGEEVLSKCMYIYIEERVIFVCVYREEREREKAVSLGPPVFFHLNKQPCARDDEECTCIACCEENFITGKSGRSDSRH